MSGEAFLLAARWVAPMDRPIIRDGAIAVADSRIAAVGPASEVRKSFSHAQVIDFPRSVLLPGLVNAHVHLELSDCVAGERPTGFAEWLVGMLHRTVIDEQAMRRKVTAAVAIGVEQCRRFGVTTVGDIGRQCTITRPLLRDAKLRVVSFGEVMAMAQRRGLLEERIATAIDPTLASETLHIGLSPHSPYSVEIENYRRCVQVAAEHELPLATHLAESPHEAEFLAEHRGPLRELWDTWLTWDEHVPRFAGGPIRLAREVGLLDQPALLAHVNYCNDAEMDLLAAGKASVVYCPRTHAYFGHSPHRWREMLARGINVAAGTDSCASSPDLNLLDDLRLLREIAPEVPAETIWAMGTVSGAKALNMQNEVGSLTVGNVADVVAFETESDDPLEELLREVRFPHATWMNAIQVTG